MHASIDCRYLRDRPSGIGAYVRALVERIPALAPRDTFSLWACPLARRPLTGFANVSETVVRAEANGLQTVCWPSLLVDLSGVDVLHAPFNLLGLGISCPTVVTVHDLMWLLTPAAAENRSVVSPIQALFYQTGIGLALRRATRIVAISNATADDIRSVAPAAASRVRVIPHGVQACFQPPRSLDGAREGAARLLGTDDPFFLVVGQNAPFKNHRGALEAFAAADLGPRVRLVVVQRRYADASLAQRARELGIADRVIWKGGVEEAELITLLQAAHALIQFSRFEGFGMPVAEAMACGAPVVASDIPALVEVTGGAGYHVPLQTSALAAALRLLAVEASFRAELRGRGLARASKLRWDRSAAEHLEVYREAAELGYVPARRPLQIPVTATVAGRPEG
jgi:glycosyltransferase involved in cell wall biosynthesis